MTYAALPTLRTPRLTLRPLTQDDADAIVDGVGNFDVSKWLGVVPYPYDRSDAEAFIARQIEAGGPVWAICDQTGLVGTVGLVNELGYWLARPAWRKGYGFEAAQAVTSWWFGDPKRMELTSGYFNGNTRSQAVLDALGFVETGLATRHAKSLSQDVTSHEMRLTRAKWQARQSFDLKTKRLCLRPWTGADAPALAEWVTGDVARMTGSMSAHWTVADAKAYIEARQWRGVPGFMLAVTYEGKMIGAVGCGGTPVSLMYVLSAEVWGQGFASEASHAFTREVFARFPLNTLLADCFEDNPASTRVLQKLGFEETGRRLGASKARLEPAPVITYALTRDKLKVSI